MIIYFLDKNYLYLILKLNIIKFIFNNHIIKKNQVFFIKKIVILL